MNLEPQVDSRGTSPTRNSHDSPPPPSSSSQKFGFRTVADPSPEDSRRKMPPGAPVQSPRSLRLQKNQAAVDEVVDIMRVNVDKVPERDIKIAELDRRADELQTGREQFEESARRLRRRSIGSYLISIVKVVAVIIAIPAVLVVTTFMATVGYTASAAKNAYKALRERDVNRVGAGMAALGAGVSGGICGLVVGPFAGIYAECRLISAAAQGHSICEEIEKLLLP